ncbi:nucleotide sugar dehydrogenase [Desulfovibrio psychrotolerans]|uniref:UDP-N-acetyl-D-galactosamine dehydrogenase n=1 Tax=Desulfovibrio psychrotolerans TaxID=415242 RepID=A0A7J0BWW0_9BACT|nr:nucleotide sugar dehydrogenase [Desulfovibrio psychrotolerans]GFM38188.1 UDP-N-acetyl-D-galactosamine dehydrogenase [Desulfovibrio psychrotolerans]
MIMFEQLAEKKAPVAVIGLGYVGLPLAVALSDHFETIGFDISASRVAELNGGHDRTGEVEDSRLALSKAAFTTDPAQLARAGVIIVAVPTPIDSHRNPDLTPVLLASETVGRHMSRGCIVVYESTVYPGLTEEECVPVLERCSGLRFGADFTVGYSPERINPGDKVHTLESIVKVVAGSDARTLDILDRLYASVVRAGVHRASSIRVAEAAKVIENTQRDLNIALMNELAVIFDKLGIDTLEVLEAAGTKWNFLPFRPGLVGGHCIGVDPYYLTFKAEAIGYNPQVILAGRRINDGMAKFVAESCVKQLIRRNRLIQGARVGVLGFTFKENVPDLRNTKVIDLVNELRDYGVNVLVHDPVADAEEARHEYGLELSPLSDFTGLDALILAVAHDVYRAMDPVQLKTWFTDPQSPLLLDIKGMFPPQSVRDAGFCLWRL